jgi:hypothetical protein
MTDSDRADLATALSRALDLALWYYETFRDSSPVGNTERETIAWCKAILAKEMKKQSEQ